MAIETTVSPRLAEGKWPPQGQWTYEDYKRLPDDGWRYEVIEGELHVAPAPRPRHQRVVFALSGLLWDYLRHNPLGQAFAAPIDVLLPGLASPVQPDVLFIANDRLDIVKEEFIEGPPDLAIEVLSPSNWLDDRRTKFHLYARAGVREYWIIDLERRTVEVFALRGHSFTLLNRYEPGQTIRSEVLPDFEVAVDEVCP
jgi:Uma2 family endonuclease